MNSQTIPFTASTRPCLGCGDMLPRYHRGDLCKTCVSASAKPDALDRELAEVERDFDKSRSGHPGNGFKTIDAGGGIRLVPEAFPGRQTGSSCLSIIDAFLASGLDCARVDGLKNKCLTSAVSIFNKFLRQEKRAYASQRGGHCYLVRIKKADS